MQNLTRCLMHGSRRWCGCMTDGQTDSVLDWLLNDSTRWTVPGFSHLITWYDQYHNTSVSHTVCANCDIQTLNISLLPACGRWQHWSQMVACCVLITTGCFYFVNVYTQVQFSGWWCTLRSTDWMHNFLVVCSLKPHSVNQAQCYVLTITPHHPHKLSCMFTLIWFLGFFCLI